MPDEELRAVLWRNMLPKQWLGDDAEELIATAAQAELRRLDCKRGTKVCYQDNLL